MRRSRGRIGSPSHYTCSFRCFLHLLDIAADESTPSRFKIVRKWIWVILQAVSEAQQVLKGGKPGFCHTYRQQITRIWRKRDGQVLVERKVEHGFEEEASETGDMGEMQAVHTVSLAPNWYKCSYYGSYDRKDGVVGPAPKALTASGGRHLKQMPLAGAGDR